MILYNTSMGVAAGLAMLTVVRFWTQVRASETPDRSQEVADYAPTFLVLGVILTGLGGAMATTHPLTANPPVNLVFGEPCLWLGVLLIGAGLHVHRRRHLSTGAFRAVSPIVFAVGLILVSCAAAILRFTLIGAAPAAEPITGLLNDYPLVENSFFVTLYALSAAGSLAFPWLVSARADAAWKVVRWSWSIAGLGFLLFSVLNFYTHVGLMVNLDRPADFRF